MGWGADGNEKERMCLHRLSDYVGMSNIQNECEIQEYMYVCIYIHICMCMHT